MIALYTLILSLFVATALVPLLVRYAGVLRLIDRPDARKIHHGAIPRVGGIAIAVGALLAVVLFLPGRPEIVAYFVGALIIFAFGVADDRFDLDYRLKFFGQIAGALVLVLGGDLYLTRLPFSYGGVMPAWIGIPLTVVLIVGVTNAINMSDGADGLAGGTTLFAAAAMGYLAYLGDDRQVALLALALIGATLGFLRYNTFPARIFMGDGGSQFLGFSVAALGILLIERSNTAISVMVPLLILAVPIVDTLYVMARRIRAGRSPFSPDRGHLHHRLLDIGLTQYQAVVVIYGVQLALIALAWVLRYAPDWLLLGVLLLYAAGLLWLMSLWQSHHTHGRALLRRLDVINTLVEVVRARGLVSRTGDLAVVYGLALFFPLGALMVQGVQKDMGWLALLLASILLLAMLARSFPLYGASRLAAFTLGISLVYLAELNGLAGDLGPAWLRAWVVVIALGIALKLRFGSGEFHFNALDVLVVLIIAIVPNMPFVRELGLRAVVVEALVLFYAGEMAFYELRSRWNVLRLSVLAGLLILALRAF